VATFVLTDVTTFVHNVDITTYTNKANLTVQVDGQDSTTFGGGGYRSRTPGLRTIDFGLEGFFDSTPDSAIFTNLGTADHAVTVSPTATASTTAFMFQAGRFEYEAFGSVGEMTPFKASMMGTNVVGLVRGQVSAVKGNVSATGAFGTGVQVGPGAAGKYLYATFHVFTAGTTITVIIQSDNASNFPSPTTVATIGPLTTTGGTFMTRVDASAITDDWFRFNASAITGTFNVAGSIGVQ
jgi:hypothetical protein